MISDQLLPEIAAHRRAMDRVRAENEEWLQRMHPYFTHALTLTFDEKKIRRLCDANKTTKTPSKDELLDLRKKSFRYFVQRLNRSLFGNRSYRNGEQLLIVGCLEGFAIGQRLHYHCSLGVPEDRFETLEDKVRSAWQKTPLSGYQIELKPYYSANWNGYISKRAIYLDRANIDWDNVRIPTSLLTDC